VHVLSIVGLFLGIYIVPLGLRPMVTPDEFRYAEIPREMLVNHSWVTPRLNGLPYFEKPALGYWLTAASVAVLGSNPFAIRFPAALAAGLSAFFIAWLATRERLGHMTTLLSVAILLTSLQLFCTGAFAVLDSPFAAFVTGTMVFFFAGFSTPHAGQRLRLLTLAGVFCGAAFLTKGFVGLAVPGLAILAFLLIERKLWTGLRVAWVPALAATIVTLPWSVLVRGQAPGFWPYFLWTEHIQRFLYPGNAQHPQPIWFFLPVLAIGALPWSTTLPAVIAGLRIKNGARSLVTYASCWFIVPFLFLSLSSGKLATYILPIYAPLALLIAIGLTAYHGSGRQLLWRLGAVSSACLALVGAAALIVNRSVLYDPAQQWKAVALACSLAVWCIVALAAARAGGARAIAALALAPVLFLVSLHVALPLKPMASETPGDFLARFRFRAGPGTAVASDIGTVHAVCWMFGRDDVVLLGDPGELRFGIESSHALGRLVTPDTIRDLVDRHHLKTLLFAGEQQTFERYRMVLPHPRFEVHRNGLVVAELGFPASQTTADEGNAELPDTNR
jgi:4-amino-4-deoxy-L-arabinose transferase